MTQNWPTMNLYFWETNFADRMYGDFLGAELLYNSYRNQPFSHGHMGSSKFRGSTAALRSIL